MDRTLAGKAALKGDWDLGESGWKADMDFNLLKLSVLTQGSVQDIVAAEPGAPVEGDVVILDETHATHPNEIAVYDEGAWVYIAPWDGVILWNEATGSHYTYSVAGGWAVLATGGGGGGGSDLIAHAYANDTAALPSNVTAGGGLITDMSVTFTLGADTDVQLQFSMIALRGSGGARIMVFVDGAEIAIPAASARFYLLYGGAESMFNGHGTLIFPLTAGAHTIELHYSDVSTVAGTTFYQRMMTVRQIA